MVQTDKMYPDVQPAISGKRTSQSKTSEPSELARTSAAQSHSNLSNIDPTSASPARSKWLNDSTRIFRSPEQMSDKSEESDAQEQYPSNLLGGFVPIPTLAPGRPLDPVRPSSPDRESQVSDAPDSPSSFKSAVDDLSLLTISNNANFSPSSMQDYLELGGMRTYSNPFPLSLDDGNESTAAVQEDGNHQQNKGEMQAEGKGPEAGKILLTEGDGNDPRVLRPASLNEGERLSID